jgi:tetratricopeptide (TPR) repeat protein
MNIGLGAEQRLRTMPLENVARMRTELSLTPQSDYSAQLLQRIRMNLGSDYVVAGSYLPREHRVHLDVMLFDARSGRQLAAISEEGAEDNLPELTRECVRRVQAQLGVRLPANGYSSFEADAMEPYARGMERLRQGDAMSARAYLETAAAAEPSNPLIHSGLAAAWSGLGLDIRAAQEAKLAFDSSAGLGRVEQLEIEGRYRAIAQAWPRAIQVYQALFTLLPDDLEYGLLLASAQGHGGKAQDALSTVKALRGLPSPPGDDPRIDLAEAQAAGGLSDFARTRQAAGSAAKKAQAHGARLQYAKARLLESGAMQNLAVAGFPEVRAEARQICAELGDRACVAAAYRIEANGMAALGNLGAARRLYDEALEIANQIGNANEKLNALAGLAYAAKLQGDLPAAEGYDRKALAVGSEMGPQKSYPVCLDLAEVLAEEGRLAEARTLIGQALQVSQQVGERQGVGLSHAALAHTLALEGKNSEALGKYNEAIGILREVNGPYELAETLLDVGNTQLEQGDLAGARKSFEETRSLFHKVPGGFETPEIEMALARLGFSESDFAGAAQHARLALSGFTATGREGDRFAAAAVLMRALIAQGNIAEASEVLAQVPSPDVKKLPSESVFQFEIARCFVLANTGGREEAERAMDVVSANAARSGLPKLAREALQAKKALATTALAKTAM